MSDIENWANVAVCGAHMSGLPLNHQLLNLGGELISRTKTAPHYKLFKLYRFEPPRPGMIRTQSDGASIEVEIWRLPIEHYGKFVTMVPSPLCIGTLEMTDGSMVQGFICESYATSDAEDISTLGSWRSYLDGK